MSSTNLGKTIEKILSKIKKGKRKEASSETSSDTVTANSPSSDNPSSSNMPERVYLKALPLKSIDDVDFIKQEIKSGNILIIRVSPLARKSVDDVKRVVSELCEFTQSVGGDIARLGEERVVITPSFVRIWREKADSSEVGSNEA